MASSDKKLQSYTSFNAGEYSPELAGRVDLEAFGSSSRFMSNLLSQVSGGVKKFYGTVHVDEVTPEQGRAHVRFVPFINKYEPMVLVFWGWDTPDNGGSISVGLIHGDEYELLDIKFPASINVDEMRWKQINDTIIFVHKSVQPLAIKFYGIGNDDNYVFSAETISFTEIPYFPINSTTDFRGQLQASGISGTITLSIPAGATNIRPNFPSPLDTQSTYSRSAGRKGSPSLSADNSIVELVRVRNGTETVLCSGTCNTTTIQTVLYP